MCLAARTASAVACAAHNYAARSASVPCCLAHFAHAAARFSRHSEKVRELLVEARAHLCNLVVAGHNLGVATARHVAPVGRVSVVGCHGEILSGISRCSQPPIRTGKLSSTKIRAKNIEMKIPDDLTRFQAPAQRAGPDCPQESPRPVVDEPRVSWRIRPQHMSHHEPPSPCVVALAPKLRA